MFYRPALPMPNPTPTVTPMPDMNQVTDFSTAISGLVGTILLVIAGFAYRRARTWFAMVIEDVKVTKIQTTNSHDTNLRDDLTLALTEVQGLSRAMKRMESSQSTMHSQQSAMYDDLRETRKDVRFTTQYVRDVDKRLIEHIDESHKKDGGNSG